MFVLQFVSATTATTEAEPRESEAEAPVEEAEVVETTEASET